MKNRKKLLIITIRIILKRIQHFIKILVRFKKIKMVNKKNIKY